MHQQLEERPNMHKVDALHWQVQDVRATQGFIRGAGSVFLVQGTSLQEWTLCHLARSDGWLSWPVPLGSGFSGLHDLLLAAVASIPQQLCGSWALLRLYVISESMQISSDMTAFVPSRCAFLSEQQTPTVLLLSFTPHSWIHVVKAAGGSGA
jgi:hypothetical protein